MGYYTHYRLEIITDDSPEAEYLDRLGVGDDVEEVTIEMFEDWYEKKYGWRMYINEGEDTKWYDHEKDMKEFSRLHPKVLFELQGDGEEAGDHWKRYFKNGKTQYCPAELVYPEYDESKLE